MLTGYCTLCSMYFWEMILHNSLRFSVSPVLKSQTQRLVQVSSNKWLTADLSFVYWVWSSQQCSLRIWSRIIQGEDEFISCTSQVPTLFLQGGSACFSVTFSYITMVCALQAHIREQREAFFFCKLTILVGSSSLKTMSNGKVKLKLSWNIIHSGNRNTRQKRFGAKLDANLLFNSAWTGTHFLTLLKDDVFN